MEILAKKYNFSDSLKKTNLFVVLAQFYTTHELHWLYKYLRIINKYKIFE